MATMMRMAVASPKRTRIGSFTRLAPSTMAMMAATRSVNTMGLANWPTNCKKGLFPLGRGSSFGPSRASRLAASASERPWAGSVPRRARRASGDSVWVCGCRARGSASTGAEATPTVVPRR